MWRANVIDAESLARKMAMTAWSLVDGTGERMLPYARALLQAEKALTAATAGFGLAYEAVEHGRHDEALLHCGFREVEARAALDSLRAVIGEP